MAAARALGLGILARIDPKTYKPRLKEVEILRTATYRSSVWIGSCLDVLPIIIRLSSTFAIFSDGTRAGARIAREASRLGITSQQLLDSKSTLLPEVANAATRVGKGEAPDVRRLAGLMPPPEAVWIVPVEVEIPDILLRAANRELIDATPAQIGEWSATLVDLARRYIKQLSETVEDDSDRRLEKLVVGFMDLLAEKPSRVFSTMN